MHKRIITILTLALALGTALAQAYEPDWNTRIEVQEAAKFTDGIIVPCPSGFSTDDYAVCVDVSQTPWDVYDLMNWSDYGLSHWRILQSWERSGTGSNEVYMMGLFHPARGEGILIGVTRHMVFYSVWPY